MGSRSSRRPGPADDEAAPESMSMTGRILLGLGLLLAGIGLVIAFGAIPPLAIEVEWWHVIVAGAIGTMLGVRTLLGGIRTPRRDATTGDPETPVAMRTPGVELDDFLAEFSSPSSGTIADRRRVRDRLSTAVRTVLTRFEGVSEDRAQVLLDSGDWTDDFEAADFLSTSYRPPPTSTRIRLRRALSAESPYQRQARRVVEVLGERLDMADTALPKAVVRQRGSDDEADGALEGLRETRRWHGVGAVGLLALGVGILVRNPAPLLVGLLGVGLAGYVRSGDVDSLPLELERTLSTEAPEPGEEVTVRLELRNTGQELLPDLRVVDGVPPALAVTSGSPRLGVGLRPGKTAILEYSVTARLGRHEFEPTRVIGRDLSGALERVQSVDVSTTVRCRPTISGGQTLPLRPHASGVTGRVTTRSGGPGTEFHSVREYRRGDPVKRVDWNRVARSGELTTVLYREENVATVMVVVDARAAAYRAPGEATVHAVDRSLEAAASTAGGFFAAGNRVGLAALGPRSDWIRPGVGEDHVRAYEAALGESTAFAPTPPTEPFSPLRWIRRFRRRAPADAQVLMLSPMTDDTASLIVRWLEGYGHPVSVISPDPTDAATVGQLLARIERAGRLAGLRERGVTAVNWRWHEPLAVALDRASQRR